MVEGFQGRRFHLHLDHQVVTVWAVYAGGVKLDAVNSRHFGGGKKQGFDLAAQSLFVSDGIIEFYDDIMYHDLSLLFSIYFHY